jgi:hypothetical protein
VADADPRRLRATIARIWRGRIRPEHADEYEAYNYAVGIAPLIEQALGAQCLREDRDGEPDRVQVLRIRAAHGTINGDTTPVSL